MCIIVCQFMYIQHKNFSNQFVLFDACQAKLIQRVIAANGEQDVKGLILPFLVDAEKYTN